MPRPQLDQVRASGRIITNYNWNISIIRPPLIPFWAPGAVLLNLRCVTATEPAYSSAAALEFTIRNQTVAQPGVVKCSRVFEITVVETDNLDMRKLFVPWIQATYDPVTGVATPMEAVVGDIMLTRMNKQDIPIWEYIIFGAFPILFNDGAGAAFAGGAAAGGANFITCSVNFAYTYFNQGLPGTASQPIPVVL